MSSLPGVVREDVRPQRRPAEQPTGVCVLLGVATDGPMYRPVALTRADQLTAAFGRPAPDTFLAAAVDGFFSCGGATCYVLRIDPADMNWPERALIALTQLDEADVVAIPDLACAPPDRRLAVQRAVLDHCEGTGTRFAVLDALPGASVADVLSARPHLLSRFGALYFPWLRLPDGRAVPPSGHLAGLYAASDARSGVGAAPANVEPSGAVDLVPPPSAAEVAELWAAGVNPLRDVPGRGIRVWGARTLAGPDVPEWAPVGVSRLFVSLARWLAVNGAALAFEPNDLPLWVRARRQLTGRLRELWRQGALAGDTPEAAFYVKCDAETNRPEVRDAGLLVTEIGLAPTVPAEFVVARLVQQGGRAALT